MTPCWREAGCRRKFVHSSKWSDQCFQNVSTEPRRRLYLLLAIQEVLLSVGSRVATHPLIPEAMTLTSV